MVEGFRRPSLRSGLLKPSTKGQFHPPHHLSPFELAAVPFCSRPDSVSIRLTVIPGKNARWLEKLDAQTAELAPFWEAAQHAFARAVTARRELERARFEAAINPFFEDGKLPAIAENDMVSLLRETAAFAVLDRIESSGRGHASDYDFHLALVPPLLAAFDALANLENA